MRRKHPADLKRDGNSSGGENGPTGDRGTSGSDVEPQKTSPRANVGDRTGGCAGRRPRPGVSETREEVSAVERAAASDEGVEILTDDDGDDLIVAEEDDGARIMTDGGRPTVQQQVIDAHEDFQEHTDLGEMALQGRVGFHTFYDNDSPALTRGMSTVLHQAFADTIEELWLDEDIIEDRHGEVTPETVSREVEDQLEEFVGGFHFAERFAENVQRILEKREESVQANEGK